MNTILRILKGPFCATAAFNMAADKYLLDLCPNGTTIFLRFYSWKNPSITVGCMQKPSELLNFDALAKDGIEWIGRITGGRAVLHHNDITYSIIFPKTIKTLGKSVTETYRIISQCLIEGLNRCGIVCDSHDSYEEFRELKREIKLPCFLSPNRDEIMFGGRKLAGSAQKRTLHGVLQHGSIPVGGEYRDLPFYLQLNPEDQTTQRKLLERKSTCIGEIAPELSTDYIIENLIEGFCAKLDFKKIKTGWSGKELKDIENLIA